MPTIIPVLAVIIVMAVMGVCSAASYYTQEIERGYRDSVE